MKKNPFVFLTLALAFVLCLALVACGDKGGTVNRLTAENGVAVDGTFDRSCALKATPHATDSEQGRTALAAISKPYDSARVAVFDIVLIKDGEKAQPGGKVKVTMPKPFEADGYVTYHIRGNNTAEKLATTVDGNNITFETAGFSFFVVTGTVQVDQQHIHSYTEKITDRNLVDRATCQRKAVYRLVCSICGSMGRETFEYGELAPHTLREEKGYDPRCERDGLTHGRRCINPGCTFTEQTAIPALGHDMQDVAAQEPTCTEPGWNAYRRCAHYCGKTEGYTELPATGHQLSVHVPRVEATCEKWGYEAYSKCSNEGCDYHTEYSALQALGHDRERHDPYNASCTAEGYCRSFYTCKREGCDYCSKDDRYVEPALGHFLKHFEAKQPDCLPGWEAYEVCQREGCDHNTKKELPANGRHSYVCDVCTTCNECNPVRYRRDGEFIYFGYWPQTCERDAATVAKPNEMAGKPPAYAKAENPDGWISHEGAADIWQKDVIYNGIKYRGVKMNEYRYLKNIHLWDRITGNGYSTLEVFWFRFDPIKWRILTVSDNAAYLMSDIALDYFLLQPDRETVMIDGYYVACNKSKGVPDGIYANNWEYTFLRQWLNETFYNEVFNDLQKEIIRTTRVDNSVRSCNPDEYPKYYSEGKNKYAAQCNDTDDKIFLPSVRDITTRAYGFLPDPGADDPARRIMATDFTKFHGIRMSVEGHLTVGWFTRSPSILPGNGGAATYHTINNGTGVMHGFNFAEGGIVPALWIIL